jgi:hypothetical protein
MRNTSCAMAGALMENVAATATAAVAKIPWRTQFKDMFLPLKLSHDICEELRMVIIRNGRRQDFKFLSI